MNLDTLINLFSRYKEGDLKHRYITNKDIKPLLVKLKDFANVTVVGKSVLKDDIYGIKIGSGAKKLFLWSQMHGNESTTTKAIFDVLNTFMSGDDSIRHILENCTICIIPILNPDGAKAYTRVNANEVDLNRDAQLRTQPESVILRTVYENFNPDFCYNLHDQRTIFSVGKTNKPATVSFLAPAQDGARSVTPNRMVAMEVIAQMNTMLQLVIPNHVGVYDDSFNLNCVGDTFQSENKPTILFEAGHYYNDYAREHTRKYIYIALLTSMDYISRMPVDGSLHKPYFEIPENDKCFMDVIIRHAKTDTNAGIMDIGIQFQERLIGGRVHFIPKVEKIEILDTFYGHMEIDAQGQPVYNAEGMPLEIDYENDFVMINSIKTSLLSK